MKIIKNRHTDNSKFDQLLQIDDYFGLMDRIKWQDLAEARMQYGHHVTMRNPWFTPFLSAQRMRYDIINLDRVLSVIITNYKSLLITFSPAYC